MNKPETSCMKGIPVHIKIVGIKHLYNLNVRDFAIALRSRKISGAFQKLAAGIYLLHGLFASMGWSVCQLYESQKGHKNRVLNWSKLKCVLSYYLLQDTIGMGDIHERDNIFNEPHLKWLNVLVVLLLNRPYIGSIRIDMMLEISWMIPVLGTIDLIFFSTT